MEASKVGRTLADFRYACVGYSRYADQKGENFNGQETRTELPVCVGLEVLVDRSVNTADSVSAPGTHKHNRDGNSSYTLATRFFLYTLQLCHNDLSTSRSLVIWLKKLVNQFTNPK